VSSAIRRRKLFEEVAERVEQRIRDAEIAPGGQLPSERELMREFGVGRPAVREALFHLNRMGLIELRSGERARVSEPTPSVVFETLSGAARYFLSAPGGVEHFQKARAFFETGLARNAAQNATDRDLKELSSALEANRLAIGDMRRFGETDIAFHYRLAVIPDNPIFTAIHAAIIEWLREQRLVTLSIPGQNRTAYEAHAAIYSAIAARDPDAAERQMRSHLEQVAEIYAQVKAEASWAVM
jgi:GntR family transcriptional regulator, sialic acid-inducible nan operon repressor